MDDDRQLLLRYADRADHAAFAELVRRHVDWVHSAAQRQLNGDAHLAADATQLVFTALARKAKPVSRRDALAGWLFTSTRYAAAKLVRAEQRRRAREALALMPDSPTQNDAPPLDWSRVRSVLDAALAELGDADRAAIMLRFFAGHDYATVGDRLELSDNAARMRVARALEKLRTRLARRGVTSTEAALAAALAEHAVAAAPPGLAASVAATAVKGAGAGLAAATAWTGILMTTTKLQVGLTTMVAAGGLAIGVVQTKANAALEKEIEASRAQANGLAELHAENRQLARTLVEVEALRREDADFARIQERTATLNLRLTQLAQTEAARRATQTAAFDLAQLDRAPRPVFQGRPNYPAELRHTRTGGEVVLSFVIDAGGAVGDVKVVRSSHLAFEASAVAAVSGWRFEPGVKDGRAVATRMQVPIVFTVVGQATDAKTDGGRFDVVTLPEKGR